MNKFLKHICNSKLRSYLKQLVRYFFFFPSRLPSRLLSESYVADFDGRSSLLYRFNQKSMSTLKDVISLRFKSHQAEGVLLHGEGQRGDYITLELHRGRLDLYLNLGASSNTFPVLFHVLPLQRAALIGFRQSTVDLKPSSGRVFSHEPFRVAKEQIPAMIIFPPLSLECLVRVLLFSFLEPDPRQRSI